MTTSVPLACIQDEWSEFADFKANDDKRTIETSRNATVTRDNLSQKAVVTDTLTESKQQQQQSTIVDNQLSNDRTDDDEIEEEFSAFEQQFNQFAKRSSGEEMSEDAKIKVESLEELVNTFDEKIVNCFVNYEEPVESIVEPVSTLNHEELINECQ